jgi:hypothetical protein
MKIEFDFHGQFRIVATTGEVGAWVPYACIAMLQVNKKTYIAGSAYGLLPKCETVYELTEQQTTSQEVGHESCKEGYLMRGGEEEYKKHCDYYNRGLYAPVPSKQA